MRVQYDSSFIFYSTVPGTTKQQFVSAYLFKVPVKVIVANWDFPKKQKMDIDETRGIHNPQVPKCTLLKAQFDVNQISLINLSLIVQRQSSKV